MSARHPLPDGSYCRPPPAHLPPYETGQIWRRDAKVIPGFERGFSTVPHLGYYFTRWINRLSTDVDNCGQVLTHPAECDCPRCYAVEPGAYGEAL